ncbi:hypothetical protein OHS59_11910 [Streptomyces sp. NBC_00414]|uniref:hypothetical protein n=1 Tax=Streptomyces sp. NBC_00414 TaxID=2975739 RepID=UPI002E1DACB1
MTRARVFRGVKGTLLSALAAAACYEMWTSLWEWSDDVSRASGDAMGAGWLEGLLAGIVGLLSMPVLLWAGMRLLRERGNHLLVVVGFVAWWRIGGKLVEEGNVSDLATGLYISLFAGLCGLASLAEMPRTRS